MNVRTIRIVAVVVMMLTTLTGCYTGQLREARSDLEAAEQAQAGAEAQRDVLTDELLELEDLEQQAISTLGGIEQEIDELTGELGSAEPADRPAILARINELEDQRARVMGGRLRLEALLETVTGRIVELDEEIVLAEGEIAKHARTIAELEAAQRDVVTQLTGAVELTGQTLADLGVEGATGYTNRAVPWIGGIAAILGTWGTLMQRTKRRRAEEELEVVDEQRGHLEAVVRTNEKLGLIGRTGEELARAKDEARREIGEDALRTLRRVKAEVI